MRMEDKTNAPVDATSNVVPFRKREKPPVDPVTTRQEIVDVLVCSLCGGKEFMLLAEVTCQIACSGCGYAIGATWSTDNDLF
jgi:hypothetical protein